MTVLVVAGSKGGPGKTTVVRALAGGLSRQDAFFVVIDADPTLAFYRWATTIYEGPPEMRALAQSNPDDLAYLLEESRKRIPLLLVDTAGFHNEAASVAIASADAVLVPCRCSEPDLYEARNTVLRVQSLARAARRPIPARVLLNGVRTTRVAAHAAAQLNEMGLVQLQTRLGHREAYEAVSHTGRGPTEGEAWRETAGLVQELRGLGWLPA